MVVVRELAMRSATPWIALLFNKFHLHLQLEGAVFWLRRGFPHKNTVCGEHTIGRFRLHDADVGYDSMASYCTYAHAST